VTDPDELDANDESAVVCSDLDALLEGQPIEPPSLAGAAGKPKCGRRHQWERMVITDGGRIVIETPLKCRRCGKYRDETRARRGKQSRNYGTRAELKVAKTYGGEKIGHAGGPVDVRGKEWNTQVKTHRRLPPAEWRKAFSGMEASGERLPRLLLRFVLGPGLPPDDYIVVPGKAWLDWFGKDE
jgi:hypothetical protein